MSRPHNITYLLGAGASAQAIPMVSQLDQHYDYFIDYLRIKEFNAEYLKEIEGFFSKAKQHASIDTFARKLFLKGEDRQLKKLKFILNAFLEFEHSNEKLDVIKKHIESKSTKTDWSQVNNLGISSPSEVNRLDKRYDAWLATILKYQGSNGYPHFPDNIKVVTWNYDIQLELAFNGFTDLEMTAIHGTYKFFPGSKYRGTDLYNFVKLNGGMSLFDNRFKEKIEINPSSLNNRLDLSLNILLKAFTDSEFLRLYQSQINFAWESYDEDYSTEVISISKSIFHDTDVLVVIGYSFPNFNREIDRLLFNQLAGDAMVYVNGHESDINEVKERVYDTWGNEKAKNENRIKISPDIKQFFIPNEYFRKQRIVGRKVRLK